MKGSYWNHANARFQREVSRTGSSRTAGAQIGEKRFALFDCVTQLWCFVAPSFSLIFLKNCWLKNLCFGSTLITILLIKDPTLLPPPWIERTTNKSLLICCRGTTWFTAGPEFVVWTPCVPRLLSTEEQNTGRYTRST